MRRESRADAGPITGEDFGRAPDHNPPKLCVHRGVRVARAAFSDLVALWRRRDALSARRRSVESPGSERVAPAWPCRVTLSAFSGTAHGTRGARPRTSSFAVGPIRAVSPLCPQNRSPMLKIVLAGPQAPLV